VFVDENTFATSERRGKCHRLGDTARQGGEDLKERARQIARLLTQLKAERGAFR